MKTRLIPILATLALSLGPVACGDGESRCEEVMTRICDLACECTQGDACFIYIGESGSGMTVEFDTRGDCLGFYVILGCSEQQPADYLDACDTALDSAQCIDTGDGTQALHAPDVCNQEG